MPRGKGKKTIEAVMHEFGKGMLKSGSGHMVTDPKQAMAIAISESKPKPKKKKK